MSLAVSSIAPRIAPQPRRGRDRPIVWHLAVLGLGVAAPFAALAAWLAIALVNDVKRTTMADVEKFAQSTAQRAERMVDRDRKFLATLAARPGVKALDPARCDPLLHDLLVLHSEFANVFTLDASGRRICSAAYALTARAAHVDPRYYLDEVKARKAFTVGRPLMGRLTGKWILSVVQPIFAADGSVAGVVGISINLLELDGILQKNRFGREPVLLVVDSAGVVLAHHPDAADWLGRDVSNSPIMRLALEHKSGSARDKGVLGVERFWAFAPVRGTSWTVLSGIPMNMVMAPVYRTIAWIAALSVAGIAFVIALCIILARPISRPIVAIAAAARRMSSHDSVEHLVPTGPGEIAALAEDLNRMLDRRVSADHELRERDKELSLLTDNYPGWVMHLDRDLRFRYVNPGYLAITGRSMQALLGAHVRDVVGDARFQQIEPALTRALGGERQSFENERQTDGTIVSLFMTFVPDLDAAGAVQGIFVFASDITQLRQAEARLTDERSRLEGIVASAMDAIITIDSARRITLFNPAAERMFGARAAVMVGRDLQVLIPPSLGEEPSGYISSFGLSGVTSRAIGALGTANGVRAGGEWFPLEATVSQVEIGGEKFYTAILRDITERRRAEDAVGVLNANLERRVAERTAELEAVNRELESFDYSISHDLRAPINRIRGFSNALLDGADTGIDPQTRDFLGRIQASAASMDQLVTDLLSLSTLSRGELRRADVDLSAIARGVLESLQRTAPDRVVKTIVADGIHADADPGLMLAVLENLLGNAWKFTTRRDGAQIEFGSDLHNGTPRFFVRDNGAGFDPAFAGKLFEPFRRLHSQTEFKGTGIGLATVQRIVRRHGGRAWAEAAVGLGATISFTLGA
jgi:PAS domain S-box-containing protein